MIKIQPPGPACFVHRPSDIEIEKCPRVIISVSWNHQRSVAEASWRGKDKGIEETPQNAFPDQREGDVFKGSSFL